MPASHSAALKISSALFKAKNVAMRFIMSRLRIRRYRAPMAARNGKITPRTNQGWKSK